ncbi:MAG: DUF115 domain-containing protein [Methanospirillum sp.]|nr:DUF115 domain-containing protein [Methanospirillum sp.]
MNYDEWAPLYDEIIDYFAFDRDADADAATLLATLLPRDDLEPLERLIRGRDVTVCGNAPTLVREIGRVRGVVLAADGAADVLYARGVRPGAVFTDLDGATDAFCEMNAAGTIMVVHAHGDNSNLLRRWVPRFSGPIVGTTQGPPLPHVHNLGGFSDGDRAAFAADHLGAATIRFAGFDLDDEAVNPMKRGKLRFARRLLRRLGHDL